MSTVAEQVWEHQSAQRQEISDRTGFDTGEKFGSVDEVRAYFTPQSMAQMGPGFVTEINGEPAYREIGPDEDLILTESELGEMAEKVIKHRWHCTF